MLNLKFAFMGACALFLCTVAAHAERGSLPAPLICATVSECTKLIDTIKDPTRLAQALTDRCRALFLANPLQETTEDCDSAIGLNPGQTSAYEIRAQIKKFAFVSARDPLKKQQLANEAKADFDKLVEIGSDQAGSHLLRGEFFVFTSQYALALPDFDKVATLDPKEPLVYLFRSRAYHELGNDDLALNDGAAYLNMAPPHAEILTMMAEIHLSRKDLSQALSLASRALDASGKNDGLNWERNKVLNLRGRIYLEIGDKEKAKQDYVAALSSWPNDKDARAALELLLHKPIYTEEDCTRAAMVEGQRGNLNAIEICSEVLDRTESGVALEQRASLYFSTGQYDRAATDYSKLIEAEPNYMGYYGHRALVYRAAGKPDLALADLNRLLSGRPHSKISDQMNLLLRAEINITLRKDDDALQDISDILTTNTRNPRALMLRAWIETRRNQFDKAQGDVDAALAINSKLYEKQIAKIQDVVARRAREEADVAFAELFRAT
ncbi:tetratricopeptide (TPR) repeat protein [Rhizobium sp. BK312]|uniref:tetratricopeptide repeat protein n=1 Tax=Rhizobium sp. BK312 TaxID=2587080 RepID=UPI0013AF82DD|nr:tetratricopeptide repeat protein [Rhizobium sp. BK312]MBB3428182.1 tetratricopeptide (TPR) repeat protein [Rhizobium sp. BK312]